MADSVFQILNSWNLFGFDFNEQPGLITMRLMRRSLLILPTVLCLAFHPLPILLDGSWLVAVRYLLTVLLRSAFVSLIIGLFCRHLDPFFDSEHHDWFLRARIVWKFVVMPALYVLVLNVVRDREEEAGLLIQSA